MMNILDKIAFNKKIEVEELKINLPLKSFADQLECDGSYSFYKALGNKDQNNIIAEIKKGSPSKGIIADDFNFETIAGNYREGGAAAVSVLTEKKYFYGSYEFLNPVKEIAGCPVLCKDFIIDPYQIYYAGYMGADAILLIARLLSDDNLKSFLEIAHEIGLSCLVETHSEDEIKRSLACGAEIVGVNNRDLSSFETDLNLSVKLAEFIPDNIIKVAESGINSAKDIKLLKAAGYNCFLIGESLMKDENPQKLLQDLVKA